MGRMDVWRGATSARAAGGALLLLPKVVLARVFAAVSRPPELHEGRTQLTDTSQKTEIWANETTEARGGWDGWTAEGAEQAPGPPGELCSYSPKLFSPKFSLLYRSLA